MPWQSSDLASDFSLTRVLPVLGADSELANFLVGDEIPPGTAAVAARLLLHQLEQLQLGAWPMGSAGGIAGNARWRGGTSDAEDWGRYFLASNGGCVYIDLDHLEIPLPEVRRARDFVAASHAMLRLVRQAAARVNQRLAPAARLQVLATNSDGLGHSFGHHLSLLVPRWVFDDLFRYRMHYLVFLASHQASSIVLTGLGKVGSENERPAVDYQLSQRADFIETLMGPQTTHTRPLVNSRDEPLCGPANGIWQRQLARLHVICYDANLCHAALYLKAGMLQLVVSLITARQVNPALLLEDPVGSVIRWSHDRGLRCREPMLSGKHLTAVQLQWLFLEEAERFQQRGGYDELVPEAAEILALWREVLERLRDQDLDSLVGVLDWVTKLYFLEQMRQRRSELTWQSPELKQLDHCYSDLDVDQGIYWAAERHQIVRRIVAEEQIQHFTHEPPSDTRAWTRAMILRRARPGEVEHVNWDCVRLRQQQAGQLVQHTVHLPHPLTQTKSETGKLLESAQPLIAILPQLAALGVPCETETISCDCAAAQATPGPGPHPVEVSVSQFPAYGGEEHEST